jgi:ABC-2 type transport system ATP-binding protein
MYRGTPQEVVRNTNLFTWELTGEHIHSYTEALRQYSFLDQVSSFGDTLHVSGYDQKKMKEVLENFSKEHQLQLQEISPRLEDVFISLTTNEPKDAVHG